MIDKNRRYPQPQEADTQYLVKPKKDERLKGKLSQGKSTKYYSRPLSYDRRVTRESIACDEINNHETKRARYKLDKNYGTDKKRDVDVLASLKRSHSGNSQYSTSKCRKTVLATKVKSTKQKNLESELKRKLLDTETKNRRLEQILDTTKRSLSRNRNLQHSLEQMLKKAVCEKSLFTDKCLDLERAKKNLKEQLSKQRIEIKSLKCKLRDAEQKTVKDSISKTPHPFGENKTRTGDLFPDIMENFKNLIESNLQCSICNEVYAFSVTISCEHTFCSDCIEKWKTKKKNCPICRTSIKGQVNTKVLDDFIEKIVDVFVPESFKKSRKVLLEERKQSQELRKQRKNERLNRGAFQSSPLNGARSDASTDVDIHSERESLFDLELAMGVFERAISPSSSTSSHIRNRPEDSGSESDTTWNPPMSDLSEDSEYSNESMNSSIERYDSFSSGFIPSRSRSRDGSLSRATFSSRSSPFTSR